jgi:hypothetical protein
MWPAFHVANYGYGRCQNDTGQPPVEGTFARIVTERGIRDAILVPGGLSWDVPAGRSSCGTPGWPASIDHAGTE